MIPFAVIVLDVFCDSSPTDLEQDTALSGSRVCPLPGDQLTMPSQQGVRSRDCCDVPQGRTAGSVHSHGKPTAIVIRETQPTVTKLTPQEPVLFDRIRDDFPLPVLQPAAQHTKHNPQRRQIDHELDLKSWLPWTMSAD